MSRAYRFSDFEAFLRKHSEASPSRQSGHADRLQLDRDSRESPPIERQGRNRNNTQEDSSDRFRTTYRHRNREYSLRESENQPANEMSLNPGPDSGTAMIQ